MLAGYSIQTKANSEVLEFVRAESATPVDRGNIRTTISFQATYQLATVVQAEMEAMNIRAKTPRTADVEILSYSNTERQLKYLYNAVIEIQATTSGCRIFVSYQISGGKISP